MRRSSVVEGRVALHPKLEAAPDRLDPPDQLVLPARQSGKAYRHEILNLPDAVWREKPRDQNVRVRPIELFGSAAFAYRSDLKAAAFPVIENGAEDTRGIEVGKAEPVDRAVHADQGRRSHIADDAVVLNRLIGHGLVVSLAGSQCHQHALTSLSGTHGRRPPPSLPRRRPMRRV